MEKKRVAIIGVGLIGGSLGMALRKSRRFYVIGVGRHRIKLKAARQLKAVDEFTTDFNKGVSSADIVVIATPVDMITKTAKKILPALKKKALLTDVGSVKGQILHEMKRILKDRSAREKGVVFVGAHPMAGSEKTGVRFAEEGLFKGATVV